MTDAPGRLILTGGELAPLEALFDEGYSAPLRELSATIYAQLLIEADLGGLALERLAELAMAITERLGSELGGQSFYLPKGVSYKASQRDATLYAEFNGRNARELAAKHGLSQQRVYQITSRLTRMRYERSQGRLFD